MLGTRYVPGSLKITRPEYGSDRQVERPGDLHWE